jgi:hypothetical protein
MKGKSFWWAWLRIVTHVLIWLGFEVIREFLFFFTARPRVASQLKTLGSSKVSNWWKDEGVQCREEWC